MTDVKITNHGSIFLVRPLTASAREWINDNVQDDAQWFGDALAVETRFVAALYEGMHEAGLVIT